MDKLSYPEELTQEQRDAVEEFKRQNIKDATPKMLEDETVFYRFMKARDFNMDNANAMFRKHLSWRKEYQVDTIQTDFTASEMLQKYVSTSFMCFNKDGHIVRYFDVGGADFKGVLNSCEKVDLVKHNIKITEGDVEIMKQQTALLGKPVTKMIFVMNYDKLTFSNATYRPALEMAMLAVKILQDNYPERLRALYVINASVYFTIIFSILKTIIAAPILEKIKVFGTDGWKEELLKLIDADELPAFLGGNKTDPDGDPLCRSFGIIHGQPVPKHYYLSKSRKRLLYAVDVKKLKLAPFSKQELKFEVNDPGSMLEWEFETKSKDIGFAVYYKQKTYSDAKTVEVIPKQRIETCLETETGLYKCEQAGAYIIMFDNSYSWISPKEIYYRAKIIKPSEMEKQ